MTCWSDGWSLRWRRSEVRGCRGWCRGAASAARCSVASAGAAGEAPLAPGDLRAIGGGRGGKKDENISLEAFWSNGIAVTFSN